MIGVVPELGDQRMLLERRLHDAALHAAAAAVDEAQLAQAGFVRGADVLLDDGRDVARGEGVEIELRLDGNCGAGSAGFGSRRTSTYSADRRYVVMPPRAVNAPVTVMRRGWQAATRSSRILLVAAS